MTRKDFVNTWRLSGNYNVLENYLVLTKTISLLRENYLEINCNFKLVAFSNKRVVVVIYTRTFIFFWWDYLHNRRVAKFVLNHLPNSVSVQIPVMCETAVSNILYLHVLKKNYKWFFKIQSRWSSLIVSL